MHHFLRYLSLTPFIFSACSDSQIPEQPHPLPDPTINSQPWPDIIEDIDKTEDDIQQILSDSTLLNLSRRQGLQIIDITDINNPTITGQIDINGTPAALYQAGDLIHILVKHRLIPTSGERESALLTVNISTLSAPVIIKDTPIPNIIQASQLVHHDDQTSLHIVTKETSLSPLKKTHITSVIIETNDHLIKQVIEVEGSVDKIHTHPNLLLLSGQNPAQESTANNVHEDQQNHLISIFDLSTSTAVPIEPIPIKGRVVGMDIHHDILRIATADKSTTLTNHIETLDISDIASPSPVDHQTFGSKRLSKAIFQDNKAFLFTEIERLTYAFEISESGHITSDPDFATFNWNTLSSINSESLVDIEQSDDTIKVRLYGSNNPELLQLVEIDLPDDWDEARWNNPAFSEGITPIETNDNEIENNALFLPFSGYVNDVLHSGVHLLTFGQTTLTQRNTIPTQQVVRKILSVSDNILGTVSNTILSFYDMTDPENPDLISTIDYDPDNQ